MGQELIARAGGEATSLWSIKALMDAPQLVRAVHDDYFAAGAEVATANTYALLPDRLAYHDMSGQLAPLQALACRLAVEARDAHGAGLVAGSLGPLGFSYQPDKAPPAEEAAEVYADIARLQATEVDLHLCETMSSVEQARGALLGASVTGKPVWLALSVHDQDGARLRSGEALTAISPLIEAFAPEAVLVNCSVPEAVDRAIPLLASCGARVGAYANGFTGIHEQFNAIGASVDLLQRREDLTPAAYARFAGGWVRDGATIVGGCCEVGPSHIRELAARFKGPAEQASPGSRGQ